jgi:cyclophilin family peptidyl-prolyl cis-trans isomerase
MDGLLISFPIKDADSRAIKEKSMFHTKGRRRAARIATNLLLMLIAAPVFAMARDAGFDSAARKQTPEQSKTEQTQSTGNRVAIIETNLGTIKIELLEDQSPKTVENFRLLAKRGYYDGVTFHRVISGFMIQGGDPQGTGMGGKTATGQPLPNEIYRASPLYQGGYKRGVVAMANKGRPETGSSQFFIMHKDYPLPANYTIFGRVIEGIEVVDKIASVHTGRMDRPVEPVIMKKVTIQ